MLPERAKPAIALVLAAVSAFAFSFALDLLLGGLFHSYPSTAFLPAVIWVGIASFTLFPAIYLTPRDRWLPVPFLVLGALALLGGLMGRRYDLGVGALLLVEAFCVRLAIKRSRGPAS